MGKLTRTASTAAALLVLAASAALAQGRSDLFCQGENDRGNRCEGRIEIPVARPELELRSFVGSREPHDDDASEDVELRVRFFLPEAGPLRLEAQEIREEKQYLMRAKPGDWKAGKWNTFGPWPTREVLDREAIPHWKLGLLIELEGGEIPRLLPAYLYHHHPPAAADRLELHLRPFSPLRRVEYAVVGPGADGPEELVRQRLTGEFPAGEPFALTIETEDLPAGWLRFELDARFKGKVGGPELDFEFFHQPDLAGNGGA